MVDLDPDTKPTRLAKPKTPKPPAERNTPASVRTPPSQSLTPASALLRDSGSQTRLMFWGGCGVCAFGVLAALFVGGGTQTTRIMLGATCAALFAVFAVSLWLTRGERTPSPTLLGVVGQSVCLASVGVLAFWGLYSPALAIFVLALYIYANAVGFGFALTGYLSIALIHAGMWLTMTFGVLPDPGIMSGESLVMRDKVMGFATPQLFLFVAFAWARLSRRAHLQALADLDAAVRSVAVREALLNEARLDLERARSGPGLFTGQVIGSYLLGEVVGRGGMGEVYDATHVDSGDPAAVKLLHRHMLGEPDKIERFMREVRIAAGLEIEHIARVLEYSDIDADIPYLAMERLSGVDLSAILRQRGRLDVDDVEELVVQLGRGLDAAHDKGIVHRDLKPANVFRSDGTETVWKILDFGISKLAGASGTLTRGGIVGTPGYMAPEQIEGRDVDRRADVYSVAVITYRCLTSRPAFAGDETAAMHQTLERMPPRPSTLSSVSEQIDEVLAIGLAKVPALRFERVGELAEAFAAARAGTLPRTLRERADEVSERWPWG